MSMVFLKGGNNGEVVGVASKALKVEPRPEFLQAVRDGLAFSWSALDADIDATDTLLGVLNISTAYDLVIEEISVSTDASGQFVVHVSSGVTIAGTACVGLNLNLASTKAAATYCTAKSDETGNTQAADSYSGRIYTGRCLADTTEPVAVNGGIVLGYDYMIGVDLTDEPTGGNCTIVGYMRAK